MTLPHTKTKTLPSIHYSLSTKQGLTLIEILIVVAVIAIITTITASALLRFAQNQALQGDADQVTTLLHVARSQTLSGRNAIQHGVYIGTTSVTLFEGMTYDMADPDNDDVFFNNRVVATTTLIGGGSEIVFERLTGRTTDYGTITVSLIADPTREARVIIDAVGTISLE